MPDKSIISERLISALAVFDNAKTGGSPGTDGSLSGPPIRGDQPQ